VALRIAQLARNTTLSSLCQKNIYIIDFVNCAPKLGRMQFASTLETSFSPKDTFSELSEGSISEFQHLTPKQGGYNEKAIN